MSDHKKLLSLKASSLQSALLGFIALVLGGYLLYVGKGLLIPLLLAVFLTYLILPFLTVFRRLRLPVLLSGLFITVIFFSIFSLVGYAINQNVQEFVAAKDIYSVRFDNLIEKIDTSLFQRFFNVKFDPVEIIKSVSADIDVADLVSRGAGEFVDFFSTLVIVFFYLIFILLEKGAIFEKIQKITNKSPQGKETLKAIETINSQIQKYIGLKTLISAATGLFVFAALSLLDIDFAGLWAILAFFLNFIPNIGSILATIAPVTMAVLQYTDPVKAVLVLIVLGAIQMVIGNLLEPRIFGHQLNLSPLVVFFSLLFWGSMWGVVGMILSIPIMASISIITWHIPALKPISILMRER